MVSFKIPKIKDMIPFPPILNFTLEIPFIKIHTELWNDHYESREREYIRMYVSIYKWKFDFELYNTWVRKAQNKWQP
jgi:hypothetical protein